MIVAGSELRCPTCSAPARDVAPSYHFDPSTTAVAWTCVNGHRWIVGYRPWNREESQRMEHQERT